MGIYRTKPIVVEAFYLTKVNIEEVAIWCGGSVKGIALPKHWRCIDIQTKEGEICAEIGDVIAKVMGEVYTYKVDTFELLFEKFTMEKI